MVKKKVILIGRSGAGKTSLLQALRGDQLHYQKTQAVEIIDGILDTPGEYMENRALYRGLMVTAADADVVAFVQDCLDMQTVFPPSFSTAFAKPCVGLITKIDLGNDKCIERAETDLQMAGCQRIIRTSSKEQKGIQEFLEYLNEGNL